MVHPRFKKQHVVECALLVLALAKCAPAVRMPPDAEARWQRLDSEEAEAFSSGACAEGVVAGKDALSLARNAAGPRHLATLTSMNNLGLLYLCQRHYEEAEPLLQEALRLRREVLGPRHAETLRSMHHLAVLYDREGHYGEAEPLYQEALRLFREVLGPRDPETLGTMNDLAGLFTGQGRYGEAEPLYQETLRISREVYGPRHSGTLTIMNTLAVVYTAEGRYGEAEPLLEAADRFRSELLGPQHPDTITSMSNLAVVYMGQGRYRGAEVLFKEALHLRREVLGPRHPDTLSSLDDLARLYAEQGRYGEAEPLYGEALQLQREVLGLRHRATLVTVSGLAGLYQDIGLFREAESMNKVALQISREILGPRHPSTLTSMSNLAFSYAKQGRFREAEALQSEALQLCREGQGFSNPITLGIQINEVGMLTALGRRDEAVRLLRATEAQIIVRLSTELYSNKSASSRREFVASPAGYQNLALSLALLPGARPEAAEAAASAVLRFKGIQADEEVYLGQMVRNGADPQAHALARDISRLHQQLASLTNDGGQLPELAALIAELEDREMVLGQISRHYQQHLQVGYVNPTNLQAALRPGQALLEIREYMPFDPRNYSFGAPRWGGVLLRANVIRVADLGPVAGTDQQVTALLADATAPSGSAAARKLRAQLLGPLAAELAGLERLYVAPDGVLNLVPFSALVAADGRRLAEVLDVRLLLTGRDLLRRGDSHPLAKGLLALGGIDFGEATKTRGAGINILGKWNKPVSSDAGVNQLVKQGLEQLQQFTVELDGFPALAHSKEEVERVAARYRRMRRNEPVEVWEGTEASKARLRALSQPPRVLHLATHGFYRAQTLLQSRPLLLAGVALAGANRALMDAGEDGILFAIEAQDLNLEGTELVVLSACETGQGQIDYGEGLSGLVRALRTAGARYVMVTLRPVSDWGANEFVQRFYFHWLAQEGASDPAAALRSAQREAIEATARGETTDPTWAQFVLVGG
jgi:CHAT domain-containing protein/Tfp pilus assembly protein PilF